MNLRRSLPTSSPRPSTQSPFAQLGLFDMPAGDEDDWVLKLLASKGPHYIDRELWTAKQRQGHPLHEISYRACFKAELPNFFISRLTKPGDSVYDPFSGRGTTAVESALLGRRVVANDINPLSIILARPRIAPPSLDEVRQRLAEIPFASPYIASEAIAADDIDLSPFYHPETEKEIRALRAYLHWRRSNGEEDGIDAWIRMVATNRLTGHSPGFFSVYTLPPNQATTPERQRRINIQRGQTPDYRNVRALIDKKSQQLLRGLGECQRQHMHLLAKEAIFLTGRAQKTPEIANESITLTVTSPPFLDIVQYAEDNWLRCWFNTIDATAVAEQMSTKRSLESWSNEMLDCFHELFRITRHGGYVAFEVGEVKNGQLKLDEIVIPLGERAGFTTRATFINTQKFTKTSNIWGINNNKKGTNSNRIVLFEKS